MMKKIEKAKKLLSSENNVVLAYLFGSVAEGLAGPLSDIDIAVYLKDAAHCDECHLKLLEKLMSAMATENLDVLILNKAAVVIQFEAIRNGVILKEDKLFRVSYESLVLQEYLDTVYLREVQRNYMRRQLMKGAYFG